MSDAAINGWLLAAGALGVHALTFQFWRWYHTLRYVTKPIEGPIPEGERVTIEGKIRAGPELIPAPDDPEEMCVAWCAQEKDAGRPYSGRKVRVRPFILERTNGESIWLKFVGVSFDPARTGERVANLRRVEEPEVKAFTTQLGHAWNEHQIRVAELAKKWRDYDPPASCRPETFVPNVYRFLVTTYRDGDTVTVTGSFRRSPLDGPPMPYRGALATDLAAYEFESSDKHDASMARASYSELRSLRHPGNWHNLVLTLLFGPLFACMAWIIVELGLLLKEVVLG